MAKKFISVLLAAVMLASTVCFAANTGDIAGNYYYVDVKTYMRNQLIDAYNVGNKTVIPAEALASYGFSVVWNGQSRTLSITDLKGTAVSNANGMASGKQGAIAGQYYYTDIVTTFNGTKIESYNIGGQTVIPAAVLRNFGFNVVWEADTRRVLIDTEPNAVPSNASSMPSASLDAYKLKDNQTYRSSLRMITKAVSMNGYQLVTSHDCYIISPLEGKYYVPFKAFADSIGATYVWDSSSSTMTVTVPADDLINPKNAGFKNSSEPAGIMQYELKDIVFNISRGGQTYSNINAALYGSEVFVESSSLAEALGMYCFNNTEFFTATMAYYIFTQGYTE